MGGKNSKEHVPDYKDALSKFQSKELAHLKKTFKKLSALSESELGKKGKNKTIDKKTFEEHFCEGQGNDSEFHLPSMLADHLFKVMDWNSEDQIDFEEFVIAIAMCCKGTSDQKIEFCYSVFTGAGDFQKAQLSKDDMYEGLKTIVFTVDRLLGVETREEEEEEHIRALVEDAFLHFAKTDPVRLTYEEFRQWAETNSQVMDFMEVLIHKGFESKYIPQTAPVLPEAPPPVPTLLYNGQPFSSDLLDEEAILKLRDCIPSGWRNTDFDLLYKASLHGYSLKTCYHNVATSQTKLYLWVLKDSGGHRFGGFLPTPVHIDTGTKFYGDSNCFVFSLAPTFAVYYPSSSNSNYFASCSAYVAFGGPDFAIYLDSDIDKGISKVSETFGNPSLSATENFDCVHLEVWGLKLRDVERQNSASTPASMRQSGSNMLKKATSSTGVVEEKSRPRTEEEKKIDDLFKSNVDLQSELEKLKKQLEEEKGKREHLESTIKDPISPRSSLSRKSMSKERGGH